MCWQLSQDMYMLWPLNSWANDGVSAYNYNFHYTTTTTITTLQLPLHYNYNYQYSNSYNYNYNYNHTTPHYIQQLCVSRPLQPFQQAQLQPPVGPSVDSLCHPCITTTHLSYGLLSLKLPPPPCAALLAQVCMYLYACISFTDRNVYIYTYIHVSLSLLVDMVGDGGAPFARAKVLLHVPTQTKFVPVCNLVFGPVYTLHLQLCMYIPCPYN